MKISISPFTGSRPKVAPAQLGNTEAQVSENCKLWSGELRPWQGWTHEELIESTDSPQTLWNYQNSWLVWDTDVDCVRSLLADDERDILMFTGDGAPKYRTKTGDVYPLGIPVPASTPITTRSGTGTTGAQSVSHVYTYVTSAGWEGPNSYPSTPVDIYDGDSAEVTGISTPPTGYDITKIRVYRSVSGTSAAAYEFVEEIDPATSYTDTMDDSSGDVLASSAWLPPSDDLTGLIALPGGLLAGFDGREVRFSEPYVPYAWPDSYSYMIPFDIVGLGVVGTSLVICTLGPTFVLSGSSPDSMYMTRLPGNMPCTSKRSIVSTEAGVVFASSDGLYLCNGSAVSCITNDYFTKDEWKLLNPETITAGKVEGRYLFFSTVGGETSGHVLDFRNSTSAYSTLSAACVAMFVDDETNELYLVTYEDGLHFISKWEGATSIFDNFYFTWKSKRFELPAQVNFATARVRARYDEAAELMSEVDDLFAENEVVFTLADSLGGDLNTPLVNGLTLNGSVLHDLTNTPTPGIVFKLFADGVLKFTKTLQDNEPFRLPGGFKARRYEVQLEGSFAVTEAAIATSVTEIKA